jgi:hypothetical protein
MVLHVADGWRASRGADASIDDAGRPFTRTGERDA